MKNNITTNGAFTMDRTRKMVITALMAALTCVGTMIIRIPTPTMGYIHPGDGFVLLSGLLLGPWAGFLAAGFGSALTDLIGGYFIYVPATFIIKGATAVVAYLIFNVLKKSSLVQSDIPKLIISGIIGELIMVLGYFTYEIFLLAEGFTGSGLLAGIIASASGIPANLIQATFGVIIATLLYPLLQKLSK